MKAGSAEISGLVLRASDQSLTLTEQHEAFERLVERFQDMAHACAYSVLGDFHLAENAAQEAFISAWQKLSQLREPAAFPGWLRRIVLSQCGRLRRTGYASTYVEFGSDSVDAAKDPQKTLERNELTRVMNAAIQKLPSHERLIVTLFYLGGHAQRDIGTFLEVPVTTVAKRLHSARARLKRQIPPAVKEAYMSRRPSSDRSFAEKVRAGIFDEYLGEYRYDERPDLVVVVTREGSELIAEVGGQRNRLVAKAKVEDELRAREFDGRGRFIRDAKGRVTHFIYYEFGKEMGKARKVK